MKNPPTHENFGKFKIQIKYIKSNIIYTVGESTINELKFNNNLPLLPYVISQENAK